MNVFKLGTTLDPNAGSGNEFPTLAQFASPIWPLPESCVLCAALGTTNGDSVTNYADIGNPLTIVGAPTIGEIWATVNGLNGFKSAIPSSENLTLIAVCKPLLITGSSALSALPVNNYGPSSTDGDSIGFSPESLFRTYVDNGSSINQAATVNLSSANANDLNFFVGVARSTGSAESGWAHDGGAIAWTGPTGGTGREVKTEGLGIGVHNVSNFQGDIDVSVVLAVHRAMSRAEIESVLANLRSGWAAKNGVTTL